MIVTMLILAIAALHCYFLYLEMFAWEAPRTLVAFGMTAEKAAAAKELAANMGLYNGFLAVGLLWAALAGAEAGLTPRLFFLGCVLVAGVYGGVTVNRRILFVQALPAAVALILVILG